MREFQPEVKVDLLIDLENDRTEIRLLKQIARSLRRIEKELLPPPPPTPAGITFQEISMLPTEGGNTLVFTGTLVPAGSQFPADTTFQASSNDPAVTPSVDSTGLVVTVPLPSGWVENPTTPLAIAYSASSASNPSMAVAATITPSAPPVLPTGIQFVQTT